MQPIFRTAELRRIEQAWQASHPGESLMERAGLAAAEKARAMLGDGFRVLVLCGPGNNGGDGLVVARHLRQWGYRVSAVLFGDAARLPPDAAGACAAFVDSGGELGATLPRATQWDLVIDALFGIGLTRPLLGPMAERVDWINGTAASVLALDIPSGLDSDSGQVRGYAVRARETITFIGLKPGLLTGDARDHCGRISVAPLAIEPALLGDATGGLPGIDDVADPLLPRRANTHKGSYGATAIFGGAEGMAGAAALAGRAALKLGAGLVFVGSPARPDYDPLQPELMWRSPEALLSGARLTALVAGPGMGQAPAARVLLGRILEIDLPLVLDADALNLIAADEPLQAALAARRAATTILTPHPAEAARLAGSDTAAIQSDRIGEALRLAQHCHAIVVLKGAGSVIAAPDGRWRINPTGNPGMASGGMGDVLSGMLGALLAQGLAPAAAAELGVYLHGAAADSLVQRGIGPVGLSASEVIDEARQLLNRWIARNAVSAR